MKSLFTVLIAIFLLNGCGSMSEFWFGTNKPRMNAITIDKDANIVQALTDTEDGPIPLQGYVVTWSPEFNAAFVGINGNGCIQPAMYAKTSEGEASIPIEIFKGVTKDNNNSIMASYNQSLQKLISVTDKSTFLSIGMYGICQLAVAGKIDNKQTKELTRVLLIKAASL